jgi:hypothetical protein
VFLLDLPEDRLANSVWPYVTQLILDAAQSGKTIDLTVPFGLARMMRH